MARFSNMFSMSCSVSLLIWLILHPTIQHHIDSSIINSHLQKKIFWNIQVGDQLLEVCGINMRSATYQLAANVLRQCGNSITMLVQYSPDSK